MSYGSNNNPPPNADGDDIVIVAACHTPLTRSRKGGLVEVPPCELLRTVVHGVCQQSGASPNHIDDVCVGNVLLPPEHYSLLRMACMLYELHRKKQRYGVVSMCVGTSMGAAAVIEVEPSSRL